MIDKTLKKICRDIQGDVRLKTDTIIGKLNMPIELFWDDDAQTVILVEFNDTWSWDELHNMLSTIKRLSGEHQYILGAIIDLRNGFHLPGGTIFNREALSQFQRLLSLSNGEQKGPMLIVGMNPLVRNVFEAVRTLDKSLINDIVFVDEMQQAREKIYAMLAKMNTDT